MLEFLPPTQRLGLFATATVSGKKTGDLKLPVVLEDGVKTSKLPGQNLEQQRCMRDSISLYKL